jgi:hypothetical protein
MVSAGALHGRVGAGCLLLALAVGCDQPVKDSGPIPSGQVEKVTLAIPIDTGNFGPEPPECVKPIDCSPPFNPCFSSTCQNGFCGFEPNFSPCNDGNACTFNDRCDANGSCTAGSTNACPGDQCNDSRCNGTGGCINTPRTGAVCSDNNACTYGEKCSSTGTCGGGTTVTCNNDTCATRSCNGTSTCSVSPRTGASCDDGDPCSYGDTCTAQGACGAGQRITCVSDTCNTRTCQGTAACRVTPRTGSACDDGNACTYGDTCNSQGACMIGTAITCDSDTCNQRTCNGTATCTVTPRTGTACNDGNACTYGEACNNQGQCTGGNTVTCASDTCNQRSCNGTSTCRVTARPGVFCDDGQS